jgi:hypothetical protein
MGRFLLGWIELSGLPSFSLSRLRDRALGDVNYESVGRGLRGRGGWGAGSGPEICMVN